MESPKEANEVLVVVTILALAFLLAEVVATSSGNSGNANLTIYDDIDITEENRFSNMNITFYANFTNSTGSVINSSNGAGNCQIQFNFTGEYNSYTNATYNITSFLWTYNRSFNRKGDHSFRFNCTSNFGNITIGDNFTIENTAPSISLDQGGGYIDLDGNKLNTDYLTCAEDVLCAYNFSANVTDIDTNDVLTYSNLTQNTTLSNYTLNSATGILQINITFNENAGLKTIRLQVEDSNAMQSSGILRVNISALNDRPVFSNLENKSFNMSSLFSYVILATDEEANVPFRFNITFLNCTTAQWSNRNSTDCQLFNSSQYSTNSTAINISFTPTRNDIGDYTINFTVWDLNNNVSPYNASRSVVVNFTVNNMNLVPYFRYVCNNERNATENTAFNCYINASDIDETNNLTFSSNVSWFLNSNSVNVNSTTGFNGSVLVNFTPSDSNVGNWSINVSVRDTGSPVGINSTVFWFFVGNINDSVALEPISNVTAYTSNNYTIYINATDNDLLISDKGIYNESLSFSSNTSWVHISRLQVILNITMANITFNPNDIGTGNYSVNISVRDANNFSIHSRVFVISILGNNAPIWNESIIRNFLIEETSNFSHNYSGDVSDADWNSLSFSYTNDSSFPSFNFNTTTGYVSFIPVDGDVGNHSVAITVSDGIAGSTLTFFFTINNTLDQPTFELPITTMNASVDANSNVNAQEDNYTILEIWLQDDDFRVPSNQKSYYNESLSLNATIQGRNPSLFSFVRDSAFPTSSGVSANRSHYTATFAPNKSDVGSYNITINVTDMGNSSRVLYFNITINSINHAPVLASGGNVTASILESIYLDFNATDVEEGNENTSGSNLTFSIRNLTANGNFLTINSSSGVINFTLNSSYAGSWDFNISVRDSNGLNDSEVFTLFVYDFPVFLAPLRSFQFYMTENVSYMLNFSVNHTVGDRLNYSLYARGVLRNNTLGNGNATNFFWNFTANFSDETACRGVVNLTLNVSNSKLSNSTSWNLSINHTNQPLSFSGSIGGASQTVSGTSPLSIALSDYFNDIDASDTCNNQSIGFIWTVVGQENSAIVISITNWTNSTAPTIRFSSSTTTSANYSITAYEYESNGSILRSVASNNFTVNLSVSTATTTTTTPTSGGGGSVSKPISLKIIVPGPLFVNYTDRRSVTISFLNDGTKDLEKVNLTDYVLKDLFLRDDIKVMLNISEIQVLKIGQKLDATMLLEINAKEAGRYDIIINGSIKEPKYANWNVLYIHVEEEKQRIKEKIIFTEEFIAKNPDCREIKELIDEARELFKAGRLKDTESKLDEAMEACRKAIVQPPSLSPREESFVGKIINYTIIASFFAFILGVLYYYYKKMSFRRKRLSMEEYVKDY